MIPTTSRAIGGSVVMVADRDRGVEWRVTYRRTGWLPTTEAKSRRFQRRWHAEHFADQLYGDGRPDLSPVAYVRITWRRVGPWQELDPRKPGTPQATRGDP